MLEDQLNLEMLAIKKFHDLEAHCEDQEVKTLFGKLTKAHQEHYNILLSFLGGRAH